VTNAKKYNVSSLRLGFNTDTALDKTKGAEVLKTMKSYVDEMGAGIVCMWGHGSSSSHGDGKVRNVDDAIAAWKVMHAAFNGSNVFYEIFNEPFGYKSTSEYYGVMQKIMQGAGLPEERCVLDGTGYADSVKELGKVWKGKMAYHFYPNWVGSGQQTQPNYSNRCQTDLGGVSDRVFVTEFGADLSKNNKNYETVSIAVWGE
jgi:hypothetical protein